MFSINVKSKEYKVKFGYGVLCETNLIDELSNGTKEEEFNKLISILPELLLAGLQKKHFDEFGYETASEKKVALRKVYDLLDDYEEESTEEDEKNGFILFEKLQKELMANGFLSGMTKKQEELAKQQDATIIPQDHKSAKQ